MDKRKLHRRAVAVMEPHYKTFYKGSRCYYCGDPAQTMDHIPAISLAYAYGADYWEKRRVKLIKVSACKQCNSILGSKSLNTLSSRIRHIYDRLQVKYAKYIEMTEWHPEEIAELNGWLKDYVQSYSTFKEYMENRFQYMEDLHYDVI